MWMDGVLWSEQGLRGIIAMAVQKSRGRVRVRDAVSHHREEAVGLGAALFVLFFDSLEGYW